MFRFSSFCVFHRSVVALFGMSFCGLCVRVSCWLFLYLLGFSLFCWLMVLFRVFVVLGVGFSDLLFLWGFLGFLSCIHGAALFAMVFCGVFLGLFMFIVRTLVLCALLFGFLSPLLIFFV